MMKTLLKLILVPLISLASDAWSCGIKKTIEYKGKTFDVCFDPKTELYLSPECSDIKTCFLKNKIEFQLYPNQSPGFSLCFQLGGDAFFGVIQGLEDKIPMCKIDNFIIDQENLMIALKKESHNRK